MNKKNFIKGLLFGLAIFVVKSPGQGNFFSINSPQEEANAIIDSTLSQIDTCIQLHQYAQAIIPIFQLIEYYNDTEDYLHMHQYRFLLARIYFILGWYQKALANLEYCQVYFRQNERKVDLVRTYHFLSLVYYKLQNQEMASYFLGQCELENPDKNNPLCVHEHMMLNAVIKVGLNDSLSKFDLSKVIKFAKTNAIVDLQFQSYMFLGDYYKARNNPIQACIAYSKSHELTLEMGYLEDIKKLDMSLYDCLKAQGKHEESSNYLLQYIAVNDSLNTLKHNENLNKNIAKYEQKELREERIDLAKNQRLFELKSRRSNFTLYSLLFSIGAILIGGYLVILFYQQKLNATNIIHKQNEQINQQKIKELESTLHLQTMESMITGQEDERERIAKDLHDSLGGLLSTIKLRFDKLESDSKHNGENNEFNKVHELIDIACSEVRNIAHDLKPGALEELGLIEAVSDLLNRNNREKGPEIIFQHYGFDFGKNIDSSAALQIYRIIQELINNSIKHANAQEILVQLSLSDDILEIIVEDDGHGYNELNIKKGMGLENIKSRVKYLKGDISVSSDSDKGTSTLIHIPIG